MVRLFRVFIPIVTLALLVSEALLITAAFLLTAYLEFLNGAAYVGPYLTVGGGAFSIGLVVLSIIIGLYLHDLYSNIRVESKILLVQQLCFVMGAAFLVQAAVSYVNHNLRMPLHLMVPGSMLALVVMYCWRLFFSSYVLRAMGGDRLLLVGCSQLLHEIAQYIEEHPEKNVQVIGVVGDGAEAAEAPGLKDLGRIEALREIAAATHPTRIVVGMFERRNRVPVAELLDLRFSGNVVEEAASAFERVCGRVPVKELRPSQLIYSGASGRTRHMLMYQIVGNAVVAVVGIIVSLPLMLVTAVAVRLTSRGPVLYRQVRVGVNGKPFTLYKFRSMRVDAEAKTGAVWARKDDPRITPVGRIIRKIRFDELPQLFNVLKGEMSIVGPRPERPEFVRTLSERIPYYRQRHAVRPGITGWAQISYKYGDTFEDTIIKLEYDLYYIKNMSFSLDLYIIFHTIKAMLLSRGAQ
jgi:sugar transferase (PEP-CTERM system associated)